MASYGTVSQESRPRAVVINGTGEEDGLPASDKKTSVTRRLHGHMQAELSKKHGDLVLLLCYTITGILDSSATAYWGSFVSMQTGNTIYFGLGLTDPHGSTRWIQAGISIVCFGIGSFCFARFHRYFGPAKRWVLIASFLFQTLLVAAGATITLLAPRMKGKETHIEWYIVVPLALIAFQSSGQAVTSRVLQYGSLTSVVLTSNYCDLFSDPKLFSLDNVERNRRVAAPLLVILGTLIGGGWAKTDIGLVGALWTAVVMKFAIVLTWLVWREDTGHHTDE